MVGFAKKVKNGSRLFSNIKSLKLLFQTFINFSQTKFNPQRLLTVMCDTLSCFLGLDNQTPLTDCTIFKGLYFSFLPKINQIN